MNTRYLIAGVAVAALMAGGVSATTHRLSHKSRMIASSEYAAPSQPIPYAQLDSYLHASSSGKASIVASAGSMPQGDTSQSGPPQGSMSSSATPDSGASDHMSGGDTAGGPPAAAAASDNMGKTDAAQPASPSPPTDASAAPPSDMSTTPPK